MPRSVVSHCAHPTVLVDIWARFNSVFWDNSTLGLAVWIGIDGWLFWINLQVNSQATKLSYFCVETYTVQLRWVRVLELILVDAGFITTKNIITPADQMLAQLH